MANMAAARELGIAVLERATDNRAEIDSQVSRLFRQEIKALFDGEHEPVFYSFPVEDDSSIAQIHASMDAAYEDSRIDYVLILDIAANQVAGRKAVYGKPTIVPIVLNARLSAYPEQEGASGVENLYYASQYFDFETELAAFSRIAPFRSAALVVDPIMESQLPAAARTELEQQAQRAGVTLLVVPFTSTSQVMDDLPDQLDAVFLGGFSRKSSAQISALIREINQRRLPSYSLSGEQYVRLGALATNLPDTDWSRTARLTAIRLQEIELGARAGELPVYFEAESGLIVNMATSRQIRVAPSFEVMTEALLINEDQDTTNVAYSLESVVRLAVDENLELLAQKHRVSRENSRTSEVRSGLLPRIDLGASYIKRKETASTRSGTFAKDSTDSSITLTQSVYNESLWASLDIQKYNALSEAELYRETELDITQTAATAYLDVLRAQTTLQQERYNLSITRENYRLAKTRVDVGSSDRSDLLRWESELALTQQSLLDADSQLRQRKQQVNRVLNRPITDNFNTTVESITNPALLISDQRVSDLIENRYSLDALTTFFVEQGLSRSPELKRLRSQLAASERQLKSDRRAYWLPEVDLVSQYTNNLDETRDGGVFIDDEDWTVELVFSLPLFEGGARSARKSQSQFEVFETQATIRNMQMLIEQEIRSQAEEVHASFMSIELAKRAERASQQNYDLVASSYSQGQVAITELLDAQETLISARESAMNASYAFLIDLMNFQRAVGGFDFFLASDERESLSNSLSEFILNQGQQ
ncbi:MAG: TolC family protein [Pseudomonadota bacterium]